MTRKPYLILDCYVGTDQSGASNFLACMPEREVEVVRVCEGGLPKVPGRFAGVLITGSAASLVEPPAWLSPLNHFVESALSQDLPILGVCFGHQLLAEVVVGPGTVCRRTCVEVGWKEVNFSCNDGFWQALPDTFHVFVSHEDEVRSDSKQLEIVAQTEECAVHAFRVADHRAWGVQFHCEMEITEIAFILSLRAAKHPELELQPKQMVRQIHTRRDLAKKMFAGFVEVCEDQ